MRPVAILDRGSFYSGRRTHGLQVKYVFDFRNLVGFRYAGLHRTRHRHPQGYVALFPKATVGRSKTVFCGDRGRMVDCCRRDRDRSNLLYWVASSI